jgi:hypothetical protein
MIHLNLNGKNLLTVTEEAFCDLSSYNTLDLPTELQAMILELNPEVTKEVAKELVIEATRISREYRKMIDQKWVDKATSNDEIEPVVIGKRRMNLNEEAKVVEIVAEQDREFREILEACRLPEVPVDGSLSAELLQQLDSQITKDLEYEKKKIKSIDNLLEKYPLKGQ